MNVIYGIASDGVTPVIVKFTNKNGYTPISDDNSVSDFAHPDDVLQNITSSVKY